MGGKNLRVHECDDCKEEACPKTSTAQDEIKEYTKDKIKEFGETLLKVIDAYHTQREADFKDFLGVGREDRVSISVEYPLYKQRQACYAINKLIPKEGRIEMITGYSEGQRSAADYQDIEIKRGVYEQLLTWGEIFFEWKGMKCISHVVFRGNYAEASFTCPKDKVKTMERFQARLREYMTKNNYFKGEAIEYLPYSALGFLKFPKMGWEALILKQELKEEIALNLIFPLKNEKLCKKHRVPWRRGLLLAGVPGTGKTQLGRVLCNVLKGVTIIWATSKAIHDVSRVKNLFDIARDFAPSLIIMEDIDFFGQDREFVTNPIVGELLNQLDGSAPNEGVFVMATTNRPQLLDRALADRPSRFDVKLHFECPELHERVKMVELFREGKTIEPDAHYIAKLTDGLTGSHIQEAINYATLLTLKQGSEVVGKEQMDKAIRRVKKKLETSNRMVS